MLDFLDAAQMSSLMKVMAVYMVALISPGPDFAMTMRNSLIYSRRTGFFSALGTTAGLSLHLTYTILGMGLLASKAPWALALMKYVGALWLIFIGYKSLRVKAASAPQEAFKRVDKDLTRFQAFRLGFFTNALNPLVILLFIGILAPEIKDDTPFQMLAVYASAIMFSGLAWFTLVVVGFSNDLVRGLFHRMGHWLDRLTGGMIVFFGLKLAFHSL